MTAHLHVSEKRPACNRNLNWHPLLVRRSTGGVEFAIVIPDGGRELKSKGELGREQLDAFVLVLVEMSETVLQLDL